LGVGAAAAALRAEVWLVGWRHGPSKRIADMSHACAANGAESQSTHRRNAFAGPDMHSANEDAKHIIPNGVQGRHVPAECSQCVVAHSLDLLGGRRAQCWEDLVDTRRAKVERDLRPVDEACEGQDNVVADHDRHLKARKGCAFVPSERRTQAFGHTPAEPQWTHGLLLAALEPASQGSLRKRAWGGRGSISRFCPCCGTHPAAITSRSRKVPT